MNSKVCVCRLNTTCVHLPLRLQLEETQAKRHDQLVEQYNDLLQEIQDLKPKVENANSNLRKVTLQLVVSLICN